MTDVMDTYHQKDSSGQRRMC